ncbi:MAG: hypothetical protein JWO30_4120 [Fibrobacteres bacterium]|nr:hypothetical protein [Fibrobacterota bacterium]
MQFPSSKKNRTFHFAALALAAALASFAFAACNKSTTEPLPDADKWIALTKPLGGETYKVGESLNVKWTIKENPNGNVDAVDVLISPDSGKTWVFLNANGSIHPNTPSWENFSWKITDSLYVPTLDDSIALSNTHCLVRVEQYSTADALQKSTTHTSISITP